MTWEIVVGLETHAQLSTASKIFSGASTAFGAAPNTQASAVDIALPLVVADTPLREIDKRVRAARDQVGLLDKERVRPSELSVGEQQRIGIARAVISKPPVLIADEPTGNLDHGLALEVMRLFKRFQEVGTTVMLATHDMHLVREFGKREIVLEGGHVRGVEDVQIPTVGAAVP